MANTTAIAFDTLWKNYPTETPCVDRSGRPPRGWDNQCAVRMSVALSKSGVSFDSFPDGGRCPTQPAGATMIGSAQRLANWLAQKNRFKACGPREIIISKRWETSVAGRSGIIFFKDYWRRRGETRGTGTGDHVDLWNRDTLTPTLSSFMRFTLGISSFPNLNPFTRRSDNLNLYSDLSGSDEIWFWNVP